MLFGQGLSVVTLVVIRVVLLDVDDIVVDVEVGGFRLVEPHSSSQADKSLPLSRPQQVRKASYR